MKASFRDVVRDYDKLYLRAAETIPVREGKLVALSSEPLDQHLLQNLGANLGQITLYASVFTIRKVDQSQPSSGLSISRDAAPHSSVTVRRPHGEYILYMAK